MRSLDRVDLQAVTDIEKATVHDEELAAFGVSPPLPELQRLEPLVGR
jgi:hypothetical protein